MAVLNQLKATGITEVTYYPEIFDQKAYNYMHGKELISIDEDEIALI